MKLPQNIQVGCINYTISFFPPGFNEKEYGITNMPRQTIHLCPDMQTDRLNAIFWHEVLHALVDSHRIDFLKGADGTHDEEKIDVLALALTDLLVRNKFLEFKK